MVNQENKNEQPVVSDRRARRKLKRGEEVVRAKPGELINEAAEAVDEDDDYDYEDEDGDDVAAGTATTAKKGKPTLSREEAIKARQQALQGRAETTPVVGGVVSYFQGVVAEVQKVTWPTREEAWRMTRLVLAVTVAFSLVLGAIDLFYGWWFQQGIDNSATFLLVGAVVAVVAGAGAYFLVIKEPEI